MVFKVRRLVPRENVPEYLKNLRGAKGLTAEDVAKELKIPLHFIKTLENGELADSPQDVYTRKYLDAYLKLLGDGAADLHSVLLHGRGVHSKEAPGQEYIKFNKSINVNKKFIIVPHFLRKAGIFILFFLFFGYLSFQFYGFFRAPKLEVSFPSDNSVVHEPLVVVEGKTESETPLYINGTEVMLARDGSFKEEIGLQKGANIIKIEAAKRYGGRSVIFKKVLFE